MTIFFGFIPLSLIGQGFFNSTYYSPKDYGSHLQIWDIKQDSNQIIYFANGQGLSFYDGHNWESQHIGYNGRGTALYLSQNGKFYASGQFNFGFLDADSLNRQTYFSLSEKFYEDPDSVQTHFSIFEQENTIYFYGAKGLEILSDQEFQTYKMDGINSSISFLHNSKKYFASQKGIFEFKNDRFNFLEQSNIFDGDKVSFAISGFENNVVLGYVESGLYLFDGINFSKFSVEREEELIKNYIYKAAMINENLIAIATLDGGVFFYNKEGKLEKIFNTSNGAYTNSVLDLYLDHEKNLWLGLWGGIQKIPMHNSVYNYLIGDGIGDEVYDIVSNDDFVLAQTTNDLYLGQVNRATKIFEFEVLKTDKNTLKPVNIGLKHNELVYHNEEGLFELDSKTGVFQKKSDISFLSQIEDYDNGEDLWIGSDGIYRDYELIHPFNHNIARVRDALMINDVYYFSDYQKIYTYKEGDLSEIDLRSNIKRVDRINKLDVLNGQVYISVEAQDTLLGLYVYDVKNQKFIKSEFFRGIDSDITQKQVVYFEQCPTGDIWFQNDFKIKKVFQKDGVWKINSSNFQPIAEEAIFTIDCTKDKIWFGGVNGVYQLSDFEEYFNYDFSTNITNVFVDRDSLIYGGFGEPINPIVLPFKDNELRFNYAAASYIDETRNTYSVKLEGFDNSWSRWNSETQKDYTNIPEGTYTFKVRSRNVYEYEGIPDQFTFTVLPPWYRTWWAYLLYVVLIISLLYSIYKIRINQILKVQRVRNRIADDLHDDLSGTLIGISNFARAIGKNPDQGKTDRFIGLIQQSADEAKEKISDIVWTINPEHDDWTNFLTKCRRHASDTFESLEIQYELDMDMSIPGTLTMEVRKNLWLVFKEIITNIAKHSNATFALISFKSNNGDLLISIKDNGVGFDKEEVESGNGLSNIKKRISMIKGTVQLESKPDNGTFWTIQIPL